MVKRRVQAVRMILTPTPVTHVTFRTIFYLFQTFTTFSGKYGMPLNSLLDWHCYELVFLGKGESVSFQFQISNRMVSWYICVHWGQNPVQYLKQPFAWFRDCFCKNKQLFLLIFLKMYLKGRVIEKRRDWEGFFHPLIHSWIDYNGWEWAMLKTGAWLSIQISYLGGRCPSICLFSCCFWLARSWLRSKVWDWCFEMERQCCKW